MPRLLFLCLWLIVPLEGRAQPIANSHIAANVPGPDEFAPLLRRDVAAYLVPAVGKPVTVEFELLREAPTQSGVAYPKFYVWVRAYAKAELVTEGAMRVAAINKTRFAVTDYISRGEIRTDPHRLEAVFPRALLGKIRAKAEAP